MLRNLWRLQCVARQSSRSAVNRFFASKSIASSTKFVQKKSKNTNILLLNSTAASSLHVRRFGGSLKDIPNNSSREEDVEDFFRQIQIKIDRNETDKALEYASEALERSKTSDLFLAALTWKLPLQVSLNKAAWDDDFIATVKKLDPESFVFRESWERILGLLSSRGSYDNMCTTFFDKAFKAFPNNYIVTMKQAEVLLDYGLSNEAKQYLKRAIDLDSNKSRPWTLLWKLHPTKEVFLKKAIECPDSDKDTLLWCEYATKQILQDNNVDAGMESLKKAVAADRPILPGIESTLAQISTQLLSKKDIHSAEKVARLWLEESPNNGTAWSVLGSINIAQKRVQEAEKCYRKAIELAPTLASAWFNLGNLLPAKEGIPMLLQSIKLNPKLHSAHYRLAMHYRDLNQEEKALEAVNQALELEKHTYYIMLKAALCASLKKYREEFLAARDYFLMNAENPAAACIIFDVEERYEDGLAFVQAAIKREPKNHVLFMYEASFLSSLNRMDEAPRSADKSIKLAQERNDQEVLNTIIHKATILARSGNLIEAKQIAEVLNEIDRAYPLAIINLKEGKYNEALAQFDALNKAGGYAGFEIYRYTYFRDIADVYAAKGDLEAAERYLNLVLEINPDAKSAAERLKDIKKRKNAN